MASTRRAKPDALARRAKREGYAARSAYKLIELDERFRLLRPGADVLDLGCAPGAWLQVAAERVGPNGAIVGVDLQRTTIALPVQVDAIVGDVFDIEPEEPLAALRSRRAGGAGEASEHSDGRFDVVLSDLAPATTGARDADHFASMRLCHRALELARAVLRPSGALAMKTFEGEAHADLVAAARTMFRRVKLFKPRSSRSESREMYVVGLDHWDAGASTAPSE